MSVTAEPEIIWDEDETDDGDEDMPGGSLPEHIDPGVLRLLEAAATSYRRGHHRKAMEYAARGTQRLARKHHLQGGAWL